MAGISLILVPKHAVMAGKTYSRGGNVCHMGRPTEAPGKPARERVTVRMTETMLEFIDKHRGGLTRAAYIRGLIRSEAGK